MVEPNKDLRYEDYDGESPKRTDAEKENLLESLLEQTQASLAADGMFATLVEFVYSERLPSEFSFENLTELVRFLLQQNSSLEKKLEDAEECVSWITTCLYEDPNAHVQTKKLWDSIMYSIQNK